MNLKVEEILMVIVAFLIGWFLRTMIKGGLFEGVGKKISIMVDGCDKITIPIIQKDSKKRGKDVECENYHYRGFWDIWGGVSNCVGVTAADHLGPLNIRPCKDE
jgi:hypothetical protein